MQLAKWRNGKSENWQMSSMSIFWRDALSQNIFSFRFHTPICFGFSDSILVPSPSVCVLVSKLKGHAWITSHHSFFPLTHSLYLILWISTLIYSSNILSKTTFGQRRVTFVQRYSRRAFYVRSEPMICFEDVVLRRLR